MQNIISRDEIKPITALGVARSGTIGYTAISQIMMFNARPSWFNEVSEGNIDLQEDVEATYHNICWSWECCHKPMKGLLEKHIEDNWQAFYSSAIMPIPLEGH